MSGKKNKNKDQSKKDSFIPDDINAPSGSSTTSSPNPTGPIPKLDEKGNPIPEISLSQGQNIISSSNTPEQNAKAAAKSKPKKEDIAKAFDHKAINIIRTHGFTESERNKMTSVISIMSEDEKEAAYPTIDAQNLKHLVDVTASEQAIGFSNWKKTHNSKMASKFQRPSTDDVDKSGADTGKKDDNNLSDVSDEKKKPGSGSKSKKLTPRERLELAAKASDSSRKNFMEVAAKKAAFQAAEVKRLAAEEEDRKAELAKAAAKNKSPVDEMQDFFKKAVARAREENKQRPHVETSKGDEGQQTETPPKSP